MSHASAAVADHASRRRRRAMATIRATLERRRRSLRGRRSRWAAGHERRSFRGHRGGWQGVGGGASEVVATSGEDRGRADGESRALGIFH